MEWSPSNAIERRLVQVNDDWLTFAANKAARLLYWQVNEPDLPLLQTYFQIQQENATAVIALRSRFPKTGIDDYASALAQELIDFYQQRRESSLQQGLKADWQPAEKRPEHSTLDYFWQLIFSLMHHHPDIFPAVIVLLEPLEIQDPAIMESGLPLLLARLLAHPNYAERIRLVLYGLTPSLISPAKQHFPQQVHLMPGDYGMTSAPRELIADSAERGPSGNFRRLFVELSETLVNNDPARLEKLKAAALQITQTEKWFDQSVVVYLIAGAAYLKWQQPKQSLQEYQHAVDAGKQAIDAQHPAGNKLVANGLFGLASVHLTQKAYPQAADCYTQATPYTGAANDAILTVEAWRMSAFCQEKAGQQEEQIAAGFAALEAGLLLEENLRMQSSLPMAAQALLNAVPSFHQQRKPLEEQLTQLFGTQWAEKLAAQNGGEA